MTIPYSDSAREALVADLKSEPVARKESFRRMPPGVDCPIEDIGQPVCAFANDVPRQKPARRSVRRSAGRWHLAEAMRVRGIVQRLGVGIGIARDALSRNEPDAPEFEVRPNYVRCTVRARTDGGAPQKNGPMRNHVSGSPRSKSDPPFTGRGPARGTVRCMT